MKTITGRTNVFVTEYSDFNPSIPRPEGRPFDGLYFSHFDNGVIESWTFVGTADVTFHMEDESTLIENKVESLRAQIKKTEAEAFVTVKGLKEKIESLLAISYTPKE